MPLTKRRKKDLSNNNSIQKSSKKFKCQICKKDFDTIKKRSVHRRRAHVNLTCQGRWTQKNWLTYWLCINICDSHFNYIASCQGGMSHCQFIFLLSCFIIYFPISYLLFCENQLLTLDLSTRIYFGVRIKNSCWNWTQGIVL